MVTIKKERNIFAILGFSSSLSLPSIGFQTDSSLADSPQYFIQRPENLTVLEGDDILLKCQVGNLQGRVQWTRGGFAMGK